MNSLMKIILNLWIRTSTHKTRQSFFMFLSSVGIPETLNFHPVYLPFPSDSSLLAKNPALASGPVRTFLRFFFFSGNIVLMCSTLGLSANILLVIHDPQVSGLDSNMIFSMFFIYASYRGNLTENTASISLCPCTFLGMNVFSVLQVLYSIFF